MQRRIEETYLSNIESLTHAMQEHLDMLISRYRDISLNTDDANIIKNMYQEMQEKEQLKKELATITSSLVSKLNSSTIGFSLSGSSIEGSPSILGLVLQPKEFEKLKSEMRDVMIDAGKSEKKGMTGVKKQLLDVVSRIHNGEKFAYKHMSIGSREQENKVTLREATEILIDDLTINGLIDHSLFRGFFDAATKGPGDGLLPAGHLRMDLACAKDANIRKNHAKYELAMREYELATIALRQIEPLRRTLANMCLFDKKPKNQMIDTQHTPPVELASLHRHQALDYRGVIKVLDALQQKYHKIQQKYLPLVEEIKMTIGESENGYVEMFGAGYQIQDDMIIQSDPKDLADYRSLYSRSMTDRGSMTPEEITKLNQLRESLNPNDVERIEFDFARTHENIKEQTKKYEEKVNNQIAIAVERYLETNRGQFYWDFATKAIASEHRQQFMEEIAKFYERIFGEGLTPDGLRELASEIEVGLYNINQNIKPQDKDVAMGVIADEMGKDDMPVEASTQVKDDKAEDNVVTAEDLFNALDKHVKEELLRVVNEYVDTNEHRTGMLIELYFSANSNLGIPLTAELRDVLYYLVDKKIEKVMQVAEGKKSTIDATAGLTKEERDYLEVWNSMSLASQDAFINALHDFARSPESKQGYDCSLYCMRSLGALDGAKRDFLYYSWFKLRDGLPNPVIGAAINEFNDNSADFEAEGM